MAIDIKAILAAKLAAAKEKEDERKRLATGLPSGAVQRESAGSTGTSSLPQRMVQDSAKNLPTQVVTVVQPTIVALVERPTVEEYGVSDSVGRGDVQSNEAQTDLDVENPIHFAFLDRLKQVEATLLTRDPLMKTHLAEIHKTMIQYDEIVNLLRPQEIAKIMAAQQVHTNMILVRDTAKKAPSAAKSLQAKAAKISLDDV